MALLSIVCLFQSFCSSVQDVRGGVLGKVLWFLARQADLHSTQKCYSIEWDWQGCFTVDWTANSAFRLILDCVLAIGCFHVAHSASFTVLSSVNRGFHVSLCLLGRSRELGISQAGAESKWYTKMYTP